MNTTEELVTYALVPVRGQLSITPPMVPEEWEDSPKERYVGEHITHDNVARLRLDWELMYPGDVSYEDTDHVTRLIAEQLKWDLIDIVDNGDVNSDDPMYKAMNGANKLGLKPKFISIEELEWYREHKPKKKAYEYTVFMLLNVEWE